MPERELNAAQVVKDIQSGLDDFQLMEKYRLSREGLRHLYAELVATGLLEEVGGRPAIPALKISASEILVDIRSGATGSGIMKKYKLTAAALQDTLRQLIQSMHLSLSELSRELYLRHEANVPGEIREMKRHYLDFEVQVHDLKQPAILGMVRDITEKGVGLSGIEAEIDEIRHLVVLGDPLEQVPPFEFQAKCRWSNRGTQPANWEAGFEITQITEENLEKLRKLIALVTLEG